MALFTRENAREMSAKANYVRWHKPDPEPRQEAKAETPAIAPAATPEARSNADLLRVKQKLDKLDALMDNAKTPQEWDQLSRAYDRMFKAWMVLSATPLPGSLKQTGKPFRVTPQAEPTPIAPQPVASDDPPATTPE